MMHPNPFNDDLQESGIPMFGKNGTALSQEERSVIAKRRGLCLKCGTKTHQVKLMGRSALTTEDVYQGVCIKCHQHGVPPKVYQEWSSRHAAAAQAARPNKLRNTVNAVRYATGPRGQSGPHSSIRRPPGPGGPPNSGPGGSVERKDSRHGHMARNNSHGSSGHHGDMNGPGGSLHRKMSLGPGGRTPSGNRMDTDEYKSAPDMDGAALLKDIQDNQDKPEVLRSRLHAFRNLVDDQVGALPDIKNVMEKHRSDPRVMIVSVGAVWSIVSKSDAKKQEAFSAGFLELIVDIVRNGKTKDDSEALQWAFGAISALARLDANKTALIDMKGVEAILEAMKRKEKDSEVFEWGCRALFSTVSGDEENGHSGNFDRQISVIENYGGISVIVGCMKLHYAESGPIWWAIKLLFRLQGRSDPNSLARSVHLMNEEDLATVCIKIMKKTDQSTGVVIQCEAMLMYLMANATNQLMQHSAAECIPAVIQFLGENAKHTELQVTSAQFFAAVARDNLQAKRQIAQGNVTRLFMNAMSSAPDNITVQQAVSSLLWVLSADDSSFDYSTLGETKKAFEAAAAAHPADNDLGEAICGYVANISGVAQGRADDIPVDLVLRLSTSGCSGSQGGRALSAVCASFPDVADRIIEGGMVEKLLEGLCDADPEVQSSSAATLASVIESSDIARTKIYDAGGLGTAAAALFTAQSEALLQSLLLFVNSIVTGGTKKALQLPNELVMAILQAITMFPGQTKVACVTIRNAMLVTVPGFKSVSADGFVELILGILDSPASPDDLVMEACGALWAYCVKQPLANTSISSEIFRSVLGLCARHKGDGAPFNGPVLTEAAGALSAIMLCIRDNPVHIPDNDIDLIISILDVVIECDVDNVELMDRLMEVVLTLCFLCKELLIQFGVIVVVIDCMVEHEDNQVIQQKGCSILALLASTENLQVNLSIAETDGIDMIVSALAKFTENALIQTDACRALSHLSIDHESRMLIASQGGLILLVNAMNKFREEVDLLEAACSALLNLSSDAEEQVLAGSSVIETIVSTMRHQLNAPRLQEKCLGVLQNISMRSKDSKRAIADAGGIGAVTFAIKEFMGSPSVLERSFTTMWSLGVLELNQQIIANEGGINLVINGMMANITYEKVQKQACGCLCTLSSNSQNKTLIRDLGGVDAIVYAMWAHYNSDALLVEACRALSSLAVNVQTNEVMIASEGEISAIMSAMRRFPMSERLQEHACVALRNFLLSADNADIVRPQAAELQLLMDGASSRFPERCAERAKQVLASLR
jgi:hypothetical protein